jgi:magnesium transporter
MPETSQDRNPEALAARSAFYRLQGRNLSSTSVESEALLDHREQVGSGAFARPRRRSTLGQSEYNPGGGYEQRERDSERYRTSFRGNVFEEEPQGASEDEDDGVLVDERTGLLSGSRPKSGGHTGGSHPSSAKAASSSKLNQRFGNKQRSGSRRSSRSSRDSQHPKIFDREAVAPGHLKRSATGYNVNYPPSMPGSPELAAAEGRAMSFGDVLAIEDFSPDRDRMELGDQERYGEREGSEDALDDREGEGRSPSRSAGMERRGTIAQRAEEDVCFPTEDMSEGEDEVRKDEHLGVRQPRRRRGRLWPDLNVLEDWSQVEKEGRSEGRRTKRLVEPQLIGGRLRPTGLRGWHRAEEDEPFRFTYFNEDFPSTIHSQTISELVQPGGSFRELFIPDPPLLSDSETESDEEHENVPPESANLRHATRGADGESRIPTRQSSVMGGSAAGMRRGTNSTDRSATPTQFSRSQNNGNGTGTGTHSGGRATPAPEDKSFDKSSTIDADTSKGTSHETSGQTSPRKKPERYGDRPTWWLDVLSPTDAEMKILSKAFGIHPLTAEDVMMQEAREKVELFRNYYFVNYRTFEQDSSNENFLEPINMYVIVFREGVLSFHFSMTPHPANVRRRIRQLKDYLILSSDWISYAIIDDITDVFAPLIQNIEDEVDDIDDAILMLHSPQAASSTDPEKSRNDNDEPQKSRAEEGSDMLRRVGDCRKKVMGLYRLLGNKADVIKGFAKRCNEHWEVAPRSEIGLYLGDIQDHIVTMTGNLSHYEK